MSGGLRAGCIFFCLQVDAPITGEPYKRKGGGLISGSLRYIK